MTAASEGRSDRIRAGGSAADRTLHSANDLGDLRYDDRGLVPVIAQDTKSGRVLMVAWSNREALVRSLESGEVHFWSRSRAELWRKGETSGNVLRLRSLHGDCDGDVVLALVEPTGPACHTGDESCFGKGAAPADVLGELWATIEARAVERPESSYTTKLLEDENLRLKKLGEEIAELIVALTRRDEEAIPEEAADLFYHLLVALKGGGTGLAEVLEELERRR